MKVRRAALALAALCLCLGASGGALAKAKKHKHHTHKPHRRHGESAPGGAAAEGRAHLKRANALAGDGDCQAAIDEYTKAYELLGDPVVLFNRAECFRRVGDTDAATDDYHEFLEKVPGAPGRKEIEAKIAAMGAPAPAAHEPPPKPEPPAKREPPPRREPPIAEKEPPPPKEAEEAVAPPPPAPEPKVEVRPAPAIVVQRAATAEEPAATGGSRPWVWVALAVLAAGAATGGYFLLRPHQQTPPGTALGNYRF